MFYGMHTKDRNQEPQTRKGGHKLRNYPGPGPGPFRFRAVRAAPTLPIAGPGIDRMSIIRAAFDCFYGTLKW